MSGIRTLVIDLDSSANTTNYFLLRGDGIKKIDFRYTVSDLFEHS